MKDYTDITERKPLSDNLEPDYAALLEEERLQWQAEASAMPPLGMLVVREIAKQQAVQRKRQRYGWVAAVVCVLLAVGTAVFYTVPPVRTAATQASATFLQHSAEALTGIQQAARSTLRPVWGQIRMTVQALLPGNEAVRWQDDLARQGDMVRQGDMIRQGAQALATVADMAKKIAAVVAGLPVQVWYMLSLTVGVGFLLAIDFLVRSRKKMVR